MASKKSNWTKSDHLQMAEINLLLQKAVMKTLEMERQIEQNCLAKEELSFIALHIDNALNDVKSFQNSMRKRKR